METIDNSTQILKKKVLVETWGCQMNVADSEKMLALLASANYEHTHSLADADLVVLNTCHIREKAKHKVLSRLGEIRDHRTNTRDRDIKIAVTGCVAQAEGKKLLAQAPAIDIIVGPGKIDDLPGLVAQHQRGQASLLSLGFDRHESVQQSDRSQTLNYPTVTGKNEVSRYVNIAQGCDNFCTFCVVPYTRGREISRPHEEIVAECHDLIQLGAKEISLLGQNVNSYGLDLLRDGQIAAATSTPFVQLLAAVADLQGLERLRFTTSNPHDFSPDLAALFASKTALGKYMHLPVQSGSDIVLERMKRKVDVQTYLEKINWLRSIDPEFAISTDLIVGFPGETEEQFEETVALVERVRFSFSYNFMYSPRKNTAAARFRDQIDEAEKKRRIQRLNAVQDRITVELNEAEIGRTRSVLFLYESKKMPGSYYGRSEQMRLVRVNSAVDLVGQTLPVTITEANRTALVGIVA